MTGQDALTFHRPPREYPPAVPSERLRIAPPPTQPPPPHTSLIQILFPVVGGVGLVGFAIVYRSSAFLFIAGAMIVLLLAFSIGMRWSQKRAVRKRAADDARRYAKYLRERDLELAEAGERQRGALARLYPEPGRLWTLLVKRANVWERRPDHRDFLHVRLGTGNVPLDRDVELDLGMNPLAEYQPQSLQEARKLVERRETLRGEPVVVDLAEVGVLAVTGDRARARAWSRTLMNQLAAWRAPHDLRLLTAFAPEDADEWEWGKWLPHQRVDPNVPRPVSVRPLGARARGAARARDRPAARAAAPDRRGRRARPRRAAGGARAGGDPRRLPARPSRQRPARLPRAADAGPPPEGGGGPAHRRARARALAHRRPPLGPRARAGLVGAVGAGRAVDPRGLPRPGRSRHQRGDRAHAHPAAARGGRRRRARARRLGAARRPARAAVGRRARPRADVAAAAARGGAARADRPGGRRRGARARPQAGGRGRDGPARRAGGSHRLGQERAPALAGGRARRHPRPRAARVRARRLQGRRRVRRPRPAPARGRPDHQPAARPVAGGPHARRPDRRAGAPPDDAARGRQPRRHRRLPGAP